MTSFGVDPDPYAVPSPSPAPAQPAGAPPEGIPPGATVYYVMSPPTPGVTVAGFVLGVLSIVACAGVTAPFGLYFSIRGMRASAPGAHPPAGGHGLAVAGLVTSILGLLLLLFMLVYVVLAVMLGLAAESSGY